MDSEEKQATHNAELSAEQRRDGDLGAQCGGTYVKSENGLTTQLAASSGTSEVGL